MKTLNSRILFVLLIGVLFTFNVCRAQVADDTNGRLYLLCKTWGFVKYYNQNKCFRYWDAFLLTAINDVLAASTNTEFNSAMQKFLNEAGNNVPVTNPLANPDTNLLAQTEWINDSRFSPDVSGFLNTFSSNISPDRTGCFVRWNPGTSPRAFGLIDFTGDTIHAQINYAQVSHRLLVVFQYWNVINYYFPYRNLTDEPWDAVLMKYIPLFRKNMTDVEFEKLFLKLVSNIRDSHGMTSSPLLEQSFWHGSFKPKIAFERIENQCVVTKAEDMEGVWPGDILEAVNGRTVKQLEDSLGPFISASNQAVLYREIYSNMIRGGQDTEMELTLTNSQSETYTVIVSRQLDPNSWLYWKRERARSEKFMVTSCGYGYVNMSKLQNEDIPAMYDSLKSAPAIIFDMRNYPASSLYSLVPYFFEAPFPSAIGYRPALAGISSGIIYNYLPGWYNVIDNQGGFEPFSNPNPYSGKIFILVNQETQSAAEFNCQGLSYHPNAKVIGTQTAGADGSISALFLPKGLITLFTSEGIYYADGYQQQRNGVRIDSVVSPTIAGIRQGRDEILEAALNCISGVPQGDAPTYNLAVFPNPVSGGSTMISISLDQPGRFQFSLVDLNGKTIRLWSRDFRPGKFSERIDLTGVAPGIYTLRLINDHGALTRKIVVE